MTDFRFQSPEYAAALWGVLATFALLLWLEFKRGNALQRLVSVTMQNRMVLRGSHMRRLASIVLLALAGCCFVVGLMRPQYGLTYVKTSRVGAQIMFCLDVSKSMLAEDTAPNRLDRAKADINDLLTYLDGDQVGLIGFAGRASVLCPLTPDYGFFKMVLADANPGSVGLGGTRLEEPLRKALDGFRNESDVSRVIVLITDGEDHDSHPLDVADDAIERGIKVVAVGIGDEVGSEIRITDPRTGVQTQVTDADGRPVISRLDGETLRSLALATEGVYIPAGTGSLDLRSIYEMHLRPLVRNEMQREGRAIRREAFQWALLAGLLLLMIGIALAGMTRHDALATPPSDALPPPSKTIAASLLVMLLTQPSWTDAADSTASSAPAAVAEQPAGPADAPTSMPPDAPQSLKPRESFNRGLAALAVDLDLAEKLLTAARRDSGTDGEVRYRATYNLGWVGVRRADASIESDPEAALEDLQNASGWFRDAVRLRPDSEDARHNLDAVLRRILQLQDQLAQQDEQDLEALLDAFIETIRTQAARGRQLVQVISERQDANAADEFRADFSQLAIDQRVALSDLQEILAKSDVELNSIEDKADQERSPEDNVRLAQLGAVQSYLNQGVQRLGQSRSQLRRRQALRGFRRTSAALNQLKRARDQLRDPIQRIDSLLKDATNLHRETRWKSIDSQVVADSSVPPPPLWLDSEYLIESQSDLVQRMDELNGQLQAGLDHAASQDSQSATSPSGQNTSSSDATTGPGDQEQFLEKLRLAMPYLLKAGSAMSAAEQQLRTDSITDAFTEQNAAIEALQQARERFADLKTLIELAFAAESQIASVLSQARPYPNPQEASSKDSARTVKPSTSDNPPSSKSSNEISNQQWLQIRSGLQEQQAANLERMGRLTDEIEAALAEQQTTAEQAASRSPGSTTDPTVTQEQNAGNPTQEPPEIKRLKLAVKLAAQATDQMQNSLQRFTDETKLPSAPTTATIDETASKNESSGSDSDSDTDESKSDGSKNSDEVPTTEPAQPSPALASPSADILQRETQIALILEPVDGAVSTLQDLRRLFFSIIQHLRETTQRQAELNDETEQAAGISNAEPPETVSQEAAAAKLADRQEQLQTLTQQIGESLRQQAEQAGQSQQNAANPLAGSQPPADAQQEQMLRENAEKSGEAAKLLDEATGQMASAQQSLSTSPAELADAREPQDGALAKLIEALQTLQPPQENDDQQGDDGQQDEQQNQNSEGEENPAESSQQSAGEGQESDSDAESSQDISPARMLQAVRDREAERRKDRERKQTTGRAPVDKDW